MSSHTHLSPRRRVWASSALWASACALILPGCSKAPEPAPSVVAASTASNTQVDDAVITFGVKSALLADPDINGLDLQVETRQGTVQLSGYVDDPAQIEQAMAITRRVSGVVDVKNGVSLQGAPSSLGTKIDDAGVTGRVKAALLADPDIKSFDIAVLTFKGEVQLTGFVDNQAQIDQAAQVARRTEGVAGIKNELRTKP